MKHPLPTTITLLAFFLITQLVGLYLVHLAMPVSVDGVGEVIVAPPQTAIGPPPQTSALGALILLLIGVSVGTLLILLLVKLRKYGLWKAWFLVAAGLTMTISFGVLFGENYYLLAALLGFLLAIWKVFRPNPYVHNFTEMFIYPGIAVLFYHILSVPVMLVLLAIISVYDIIAVYKSKHMVSMADFQTKSDVFAGLAIPRAPSSEKKKIVVSASGPAAKIPKATTTAKKVTKSTSSGVAILGGGDIALPLLFAAVVMKSLVEQGLEPVVALSLSTIIAVTTTCMLALLFFSAQKGRYYPAMPAVSFGAIAGWLIILLLV